MIKILSFVRALTFKAIFLASQLPLYDRSIRKDYFLSLSNANSPIILRLCGF